MLQLNAEKTKTKFRKREAEITSLKLLITIIIENKGCISVAV